MPSVSFFNRRFTPSWQMILLTLIVTLVLARLGFWQLARAAEKEKILSANAHLSVQKAFHWKINSPSPQPFQRIKVQGHFNSQLFFLDNQHYNHQFGYDILSPFEIEPNQIVMVDRGWVAAGLNRSELPSITTSYDNIILEGVAYYPAKPFWSLGPMSEARGKNQTIIEAINPQNLSHILQKKVYPFIIRLGNDQEGGFVRHWALVSMPPQRHLAYALQWFVMAAVVVIIFIALNLKKDYEKSI